MTKASEPREIRFYTKRPDLAEGIADMLQDFGGPGVEVRQVSAPELLRRCADAVAGDTPDPPIYLVRDAEEPPPHGDADSQLDWFASDVGDSA